MNTHREFLKELEATIVKLETTLRHARIRGASAPGEVSLMLFKAACRMDRLTEKQFNPNR